MANTIYINPTGITQKADSMIKKADEYREIIRNITKLTISLCDVWDGNAFNRFVNKYDSVLPTLEKMATAYEDTAASIKKQLKSIQDADTAAANKIKNLF